MSRPTGRTGRPFTFYLREGQANELDALAQQRHVAKAELIRFAIDRFLAEIKGGQLELPLGIQGS
jgi:hypothetical protein